MEMHKYFLHLRASMEWLSFLKNASTRNGIFIYPAPYWQGVCRAGWLVHSIFRGRERFPLPVRPPACCSGCPHRAEVSLWLPLGLPATESPTPDAARCLPSPVTILRFTSCEAGRSWRSWLSGATLSRECLLKPLHTGIQFSSFLHSGGKPLALKACNKHKVFPKIFLLIKVGIFANPYPSLWVLGCPSTSYAIL